jgi:hypothetical protein
MPGFRSALSKDRGRKNFFPRLGQSTVGLKNTACRPGQIKQATIQYFSSCMSCAFPTVFPFRLKLPLRSP